MTTHTHHTADDAGAGVAGRRGIGGAREQLTGGASVGMGAALRGWKSDAGKSAHAPLMESKAVLRVMQWLAAGAAGAARVLRIECIDAPYWRQMRRPVGKMYLVSCLESGEGLAWLSLKEKEELDEAWERLAAGAGTSAQSSVLSAQMGEGVAA